MIIELQKKKQEEIHEDCCLLVVQVFSLCIKHIQLSLLRATQHISLYTNSISKWMLHSNSNTFLSFATDALSTPNQDETIRYWSTTLLGLSQSNQGSRPWIWSCWKQSFRGSKSWQDEICLWFLGTLSWLFHASFFECWDILT